MGDEDSQGLGWSDLLSISSVSALALVAGGALGWWIDSLLHTSPAFFMVGLAIGIAAAISFAVVQIRKYLH